MQEIFQFIQSDNITRSDTMESSKLIAQELDKKHFLRTSQRGCFELYVVNAHTAPHVMDEIGRLREIAFQSEGGGTGKDKDIDSFDNCENPYHQLVLWNPRLQEIVGGYRFRSLADLNSQQDLEKHIDTAKLFSFSQEFKETIRPYCIELGRSFTGEKYQASKLHLLPRQERRGAIFSLHSLFDGLGALTKIIPESTYFFGKFTMYPSFTKEAKQELFSFLHTYFPDTQQLVVGKQPITHKKTNSFTGNDYATEYKQLQKILKTYGENIPPLVNTYMNLSNSMKTFSTVKHESFGGVEETGILININDIYPTKVEKHIDSFVDETSLKKIRELQGLISYK